MKNRILVIDDDASVRSSLQSLLEGLGYNVMLAGDGLEGMTYLNAQPFDLLILDMALPQITGWDILDLLGERKLSLPVVILTAFSDECVPGSLLGADVLLEKPPDVNSLISTVSFLLAEEAASRLQRRRAGLMAPRLVLTDNRCPLPS